MLWAAVPSHPEHLRAAPSADCPLPTHAPNSQQVTDLKDGTPPPVISEVGLAPSFLAETPPLPEAALPRCVVPCCPHAR